MPFAVEAHPDFSWSHSRARMLESDCVRRYYWHYYGSHLGWREDADEEAQLAYRLKNLQTLPMVLGLQVHERAREIASAIRDGVDPPSLDDCRERTRGEMNRVWRGSRDRESFVRSPKRNPMLVEIYYGLPLSNDRLLRLRAKMESCLLHLCTWPGWEDLQGLGPDEILLYDPTDPIEHEGSRLYAAPDLVYRDSDGVWEVLDWKTGDCTGAEDQLATYALYLRARAPHPAFDGATRGRIVRLDEGEEEVVDLTEADLERAAKRIRDSIWEMRGYLLGLDSERNQPQPRERFTLPIDGSRCSWCPFFELCEEDLKHPQHFGPF